MRAGRFLDAQLCGQQALAADPGHAGSLQLMGLLAVQAEQYDHAIEWFGRAIRQNPDVEYLSNLGMALTSAARLDEALDVFDKAVQLKPNDAARWHELAGALAALKRDAEALLAWQHTFKLDPHHWEAAHRCATYLHGAERLEEALSYLDICDRLRPDHAPTLRARARCLRSLKRHEAALADVMRAHALDPANPVSANNAGNALLAMDRPEQALPWFDKALALHPGSVEILLNKAIALGELHRFDEALASYDRAQAVDPADARLAFHRAHVDLLIGNFAAGWAGREARSRVPGLPIIYPDFPQPIWLGEGDIEGRTVLVYSDEGLGDALQFARYLPMLAARGARVVLVVQDALFSLLSQMPGIRECRPYLAMGMPSAFDRYCPLSSLPLAFGTRLETIPPPACLPATAARVQAWEERLGAHDRLRVGLVWSGNPKHLNDRTRSVPLRTMARLFDVDAMFVSLQKDPRPDDRAFLDEQHGIVDLTAGLVDFAETAALIACLDLVISVDTSVAHLAATLGCPTWILLPHLPDWRWLLGRDDSPWYPAVRLFRQTETRDYASVLDRVHSELAAQVSAFDGAHDRADR